jgi:hypothetical protein
MRKLIDYIRSCFCKHEWEQLDENEVYSNTDYWGRTVDPYRIGTKWTYRCKKCGYFKVHKNY